MTAVVALLVAAALPEATPLSLSVEVTPEEVTLGEPIDVRIAVEHDARDVYSLGAFDPAPLSSSGWRTTPRSSRAFPISRSRSSGRRARASCPSAAGR